MTLSHSPAQKSLWLAVFALLAPALTTFAVTDSDPGKIGGTANPDAIPSVEPEEALLLNIKYPEGMEARLFARDPDVQDPTAISFDEKNRLYLAETHRFDRGVEDNRRNPWVADDYALTSTAERLEMYKKYEKNKPLTYFTKYSEKIRVIEDRDGDGRADFAQIFAEGFNDPLDGTAAGVMALDGKVYFACIPNVWMLEDTDGDLVADKRESLQEGYGISVSLGGHDLNGFALGPDNRIYFTIGDRGYNLKTSDARHLYNQYEGAAFRMERDGSKLEVLHTGLRNPKEVAFDSFGNLFTVDNNADMGDEARVVEIIEGGYSGWQRGHQAFQKWTHLIYGASRHSTTWMTERQWDMDSKLRPQAILRPSGWISKGPSGLAYNPGTGLAEKWDNHFFICDFIDANSSVIGFRMEPDGAGFKVGRHETFVSGMLCTDVEFGYDSKAYVTDYVGSWPTHGFGNIFTFEDPSETAKPETKAVRGLFAEGFTGMKSAKLVKLLRHPDMRVRLRSQFALADDVANRELLFAATQSSEPVTTRLHGVWGLGNLARLKSDDDAAKMITKLCSDPDARVRGQAVKVLGESGYKASLQAASTLLKDPDLRARMLAAIAVGKLGTKTQVPALMEVISQNNDEDEYLRHGAIQGMIGIGDADSVVAFSKDNSPAVRRAVVLALRRFGDARIGTMLNDQDLSVAVEAVQAINDAYIEGARMDLAAATHLIGKSTWPVDLRILNAMIRVGGDENARRLLTIAKDASFSDDARTEALFLLGRFEKSPATDPTTGMYRPIEGQREIGKQIRKEIRDSLLPMLEKSTGNLLSETLGLAGKFDVKIPTPTLINLLTDAKNPLQVRLSALEKLKSERPPGLSDAVADLATDRNAQMRQAALGALSRIDPVEALAVIRQILSSGKVSDMQLAIAQLGTLSHPEAPSVLLDLLNGLQSQPGAIHLDIIDASEKRIEPELKAALGAYMASIEESDPLAAFQVALEGGNKDNGRKIFFNDGSANCVQCHKVGERGGDAGPNLQGIASRQDANYILQSMIDPAAKLAPGFSTIAVTMKDGRVVAGMLAKETDTEVVIRNPKTLEDTICKKSEINKMPPAISTMPPMGLILNKGKIRDLMAFLSSLK